MQIYKKNEKNGKIRKKGLIMDKRAIGQVNLFLSGIVGRLKDNREYFKSIKAIMKAGTKPFTGIFAYDGDKYYFDFQGVKKNNNT